MGNGGLTLLEIIISIAAIGIILSMVILQTGNPKGLAEEALSRSKMERIHLESAVYGASRDDDYSGFCAQASVQEVLENLNSDTPLQRGASADIYTVRGSSYSTGCRSGRAGWTAWATFPNGTVWCIEKGGHVRTVTVQATTVEADELTCADISVVGAANS